MLYNRRLCPGPFSSTLVIMFFIAVSFSPTQLSAVNRECDGEGFQSRDTQNPNGELDERNECDENDDGWEPDVCGECPPILFVTLNGINTNIIDSPFHRWVYENTPDGLRYIIDPWAHPDNPMRNAPDEYCQSSASDIAPIIRRKIEEIQEANPCVKVILIGHSFGGILAWQLQGYADCSIFIDPPVTCYPFGKVCPSQRDICRAVDEGIKEHPFYVPTEEHWPFDDLKANCEDLKRIRDKIDECVQDVRPNCPENGDTPSPPPNCGDECDQAEALLLDPTYHQASFEYVEEFCQIPTENK